jgi:hypothetical protein
MYGQVAPPSNTSVADSTSAPWLQGKAGEGINAELHGRSYTSAYRGRTFIGTTAAAGVVLPVNTTTASTCLLYNPAGSGVIAEMLHTDIGLLASTTVIGTIFFGISLIAPTANTAITTVTPGLVGGSAVAQLKYYSASTIVAANTTQFLACFQITTTATIPISTHYDWDGKLILQPGSSLIGYSVPVQTAAINVSHTWAEYPV